MTDYQKEYSRWLSSSNITAEERGELMAIAEDTKEIKSRFGSCMTFGTAGLRGIMGAGINRMNIYTIRQATQGFAEVIKAQGKDACERGVFICYDCRINSEKFAKEAAQVMAANGIKVKLFESMRPTPELSFAIREYGCIAGINITASHNPKEYNGYKVYWEDGAQLPPAHAEKVAEAILSIDIFEGVRSVDFEQARAAGKIELMGSEVDEKFIACVMSETNGRAENADDVVIVYTPFHGTGFRLVPEVFARQGFSQVHCVESQMKPDGTFPTVGSPNPEDPAGFKLAVELAKEKNADIIIGTDPDTDRVAAMTKADNGEYAYISGNKTGVLLLDYLIKRRRENGTLPENAAVLKSIVTTELAREVAQANNIYIEDTFTGFKFMAEKIKEYEGKYKVIFSYEESIGYLIGDFVRDKDAVTASALIAEMAAWYKQQGKTLLDVLDEISEKYGCYEEKTINIAAKTDDDIGRLNSRIGELRKSAPDEIGGLKVLGVRDYLEYTGKTPISGTDVLYYELEGGTAFIVRPSGTEPKVKVYILARGETRERCAAVIAGCSAFADEKLKIR